MHSSIRGAVVSSLFLSLVAASLFLVSQPTNAASTGSGNTMSGSTMSGSTMSGSLFTDVSTHWGKTYISYVVTNCGVTGYKDAAGKATGMFKPDNKITRAEFIKIVVGCSTGSGSMMTGSGSTASGSTMTGSGSTFTDVASTHWAANYIAKAKAMGLITGYTDGTFRPNQEITRAEIIAIIVRAEFPGQVGVNMTNKFSDNSKSAWYYDYINFAASKGLISGYKDASGTMTGQVGPDNSATRAEAAKVISNGFTM